MFLYFRLRPVETSGEDFPTPFESLKSRKLEVKKERVECIFIWNKEESVVFLAANLRQLWMDLSLDLNPSVLGSRRSGLMVMM